MIDQIKERIKDVAMHYWTDHKAAVIIVAVVLIIAIIKQVLMNLADLLKKNIVMIPVVASVLVGTFTGVKYIVNLTDTINGNQAQIQSIQEMDIVNLQRELKVADGHIQELKQRLERAEATWEMAENLYDLLGQKVNELEWDVKDLNR